MDRETENFLTQLAIRLNGLMGYQVAKLFWSLIEDKDKLKRLVKEIDSERHKSLKELIDAIV